MQRVKTGCVITAFGYHKPSSRKEMSSKVVAKVLLIDIVYTTLVLHGSKKRPHNSHIRFLHPWLHLIAKID
jgi:hypothetical protein